MQTKIILILGVLVLLVSHGTLYKKYKEVKQDRNRISQNYEVINQELDSVVGKNGELFYKINSLNLTQKELEETNKDLVANLDNMRIKLKNLESATNVEIEYIVKDSIIYVKSISDTVFVTTKADDWLYNSWTTIVTEKNNKPKIKVTDYELSIHDSILIASEIEYKGWWFWKKAKNVKIHLKSENPYSQVNRIENIKISRK